MKLFRNLGLLVALLSLCSPASAQELLVQWSNTSKLSQGDATLKALQGARVSSFQTPLMRKNNRGVIEKIKLPAGSNVQQAIETFRKVPGVVSVEENQVYKTFETSDDALYVNGSLWGMYSSDTPSAGPSNTTNSFGSQAEQAWAGGKVGSMRTVVGVIDTGVDYTHPDLYLNIYLNQGEIKILSFYNSLTDVDGDGIITFRDLNNAANFSYVTDKNGNSRIDAGDLLTDSRWENGVDDDGNGYIDDLIGWDFVSNDNDPMDDHDHGTHVAGTIGGIGGNSVGVAGVNWKVQIMPLKFLDSNGSGFTDDAVMAIDYFTSTTQAQDKAYNQSSVLTYLGTNNSWGGGGYSSLLKTSIDNGALVNNHFIAAAGNSASNNNTYPTYPTNYSTLSVAGWEAVTSVASLVSNGTLSSFSNYGSTTVDLGAPGSSIQSTTPNSTYSSFSGTSMATPHVAGSLALFASSYPQATRRELREVLLSTTTATSSLSGKVVTNGRLDLQAGLTELELRYSDGTPYYSLSGTASSNEGSTILINITTRNVVNGTPLYWSITGIQLSDTTLLSLQGSVSVSSGSASVSIPIRNDSNLEGLETLEFRLFTDSSRLNLVSSRSVPISDTSTGLTSFWGTTSNNTIVGNSSANSITGVPSSGTTTAQLGKGQIDTVTGGLGADVFVLGQTREGMPRVFYNNGVLTTTGTGDYLLITDFNRSQDRLRFVPGTYFSRVSGFSTLIYWDRNNNGTLQTTGASRDEVIAFIRNVNLGNLTLTNGSVPWIVMIP